MKEKKTKLKAANDANFNVFYSFKFYSFYLPSSIKGISLYSRSRDWTSGTRKILIKQSYIMLVWFKYITTLYDIKIHNNFSEENTNFDSSTKLLPSFFIYPPRLYKFTSLKSPMAHKTFSQEQFLCKNYKLSISFKSDFTSCIASTTTDGKLPLNFESTLLYSLNNSLYFTMFFFCRMPSISTNMFLVQRFTLRFWSWDKTFFSLFTFR